MFRLTKQEDESLRFQTETSNVGRGGRRYLPYVFTEHGVAMLSSVLGSERAVQMNIVIIRAFIKLREILATHEELAQRLENLERKYEDTITSWEPSLRPPTTDLRSGPPKHRIGFSAAG